MLDRTRKLELAAFIRNNGQEIRVHAFKALTNNDPTVFEETYEHFEEIATAITELEGLTNKQENLARLKTVRDTARQYQGSLEKRAQAVTSLNIAHVGRDEAGTAVLDVADKSVAAAETHTRTLAQSSVSILSRTSWGLLTAVIVAVSLTMVGGISLTRRIARPVREGVGVLASASSEISTTVSQIAASANETASAVAQTTTTVDEVRQTAQLASDKAKGVLASAQAADEAAQRGKEATEGTEEGMRRIEEQTEVLAKGIMELSEKSQAVGDIISAVSDLAEQSNLLAVNAAIEAAKAGEQGRGFAVVAQEIRSLAEQSKEATSRIKGILGEVQQLTSSAVLATEQTGKVVEEGRRQAEQAGETIDVLTTNVEEAATAATQIATSSQQQLVGMEQVASAMNGIKEASVQNQDSTRQLTTAAENLKELGRQLRTLVEGGARGIERDGYHG